MERISNLSSCPAIKILGVHLDENLSFDYHCQKVLKKVNSALFHISSAKHMLSTKTLIKLYYALVHPHLLYCLPAFSFTSVKNRKMISNKLKQVVRIICKAKYNAHTEPLFFKTQILPFDDLILQQKLIFMHAIVHNYSSVCFPHFITNLTFNAHRFNLRNENDFFVPRTDSSFVQRMPLIDFPAAWNNIDQSLKSIASKQSFKKILKQELLDKYRNFTCDRSLCISCINSY